MTDTHLASHRGVRNGAPAKQGWLRVAVYAGLISFFFSLTAFNLVDVDIWHEMSLIRESFRVGHLLTRDVFAYTPSVYPMIHHEWGAGLIAYVLTLRLGSDSLLVLKYSIALLIGYLCLRCATSMGADVRTWAALCPLAICLSQYGFISVIRAQVYSFLFAACCFWAFEKDRRGSRRWWIAWLCIFPVWVNVHGGFVVGIGLLALYLLERIVGRQPFRHLLLVLAGSVAEVFINPFGTAYLRYIVHALAMSRPHIQEWRPVWDFGGWWIALFLAAVGIVVYCVVRIGVCRVPGLLMVVATAIEAALHIKLMPLFAIAWISHVPAYLQETEVGRWIMTFHNRRFNFAVAVWIFLAFASLGNAVRWQFWRLRVPQNQSMFAYPVGAVEYLRDQRFAGNLMVPFREGAYVSWKLFPAVKVSVDSRYEVAYSDEWVDRTFKFYGAEPGWRGTLSAYATDAVLVPRNAPIAAVIAQSGWNRVYQDREFEIFSRSGMNLARIDRTSESFAGVLP